MRKLKFALLLLAAVLATLDLLASYAQAIHELDDRATIPFHSLGFQFLGLKKVFKDIRTAGYYTDKDLNNTVAIAQYEQAQYMLAPTALDLNHMSYHWGIFDCTSPEAALDAAKRLGFIPLKANHGIILAYNPNGI